VIKVTDDPAAVDFEAVHRFLDQESHWAQGIPRATLERALRHSLCFSALDDGRFVGFARVVTDRATFAWLCDVFVEESHRGRGIARALMQAIDSHADLQQLRRFLLATRSAPGLYAKHGFVPLERPGVWMERYDGEVYTRAAAQDQPPPA
jgi:GNAT superfamily N-acetyltransferase